MPRASSGTVKAVSRYEITRAAAIVSARYLKKAPVTPVRKASGRKMMIVARLEPKSGAKNSRAAGNTVACARSSLGTPARRAMCSTITMTSSIKRPIAAAMPPRVMMLKLMPSTESSSMVISTDSGTTVIATSMTRQFRKYARMTSAAKPSPIAIASSTAAIEERTSSVWSYHL